AVVLELLGAGVSIGALLQVASACAVLILVTGDPVQRIGVADGLAGLVEHPGLRATIGSLQLGGAAAAIHRIRGQLAQGVRDDCQRLVGILGGTGGNSLGSSGGYV